MPLDRHLSEGLGPTRSPVLRAFAPSDEKHSAWREDLGSVPDIAWNNSGATASYSL